MRAAGIIDQGSQSEEERNLFWAGRKSLFQLLEGFRLIICV